MILVYFTSRGENPISNIISRIFNLALLDLLSKSESNKSEIPVHILKVYRSAKMSKTYLDTLHMVVVDCRVFLLPDNVPMYDVHAGIHCCRSQTLSIKNRHGACFFLLSIEMDLSESSN